MDFNSLSVTLHLLIILFGTVVLATVSLTVCVRVLLSLTPSAAEDLDDDYHGVDLVQTHRPR
jgi:hypothetical protein